MPYIATRKFKKYQGKVIAIGDVVEKPRSDHVRKGHFTWVSESGELPPHGKPKDTDKDRAIAARLAYEANKPKPVKVVKVVKPKKKKKKKKATKKVR